MQLLGKLILHSLPSKKMSIKSVCMLSYQAISIIEHVHSRYFIHRDIKPDNFAVGKELSSLLYLIDFGLAKMFIDPETKKQIPMTARKKLTGTARYASVHALMGMEQSRRDDLESFAYVIVYLLSGTLPWQGIITKNKEEKYAMILDRKKNITSEELCKNLPKYIELYVGYVKNLQYEEDPDYDYLKGLFEECIRGMNETYDNIYDWSTISNFRTVLSNTGKENFTLRARATSSLSFGNNKTIVNNFVVNNSHTYVVNNNSFLKADDTNLNSKSSKLRQVKSSTFTAISHMKNSSSLIEKRKIKVKQNARCISQCCIIY